MIRKAAQKFESLLLVLSISLYCLRFGETLPSPIAVSSRELYNIAKIFLILFYFFL